jgi:hypothetical protein
MGMEREERKMTSKNSKRKRIYQYDMPRYFFYVKAGYFPDGNNGR